VDTIHPMNDVDVVPKWLGTGLSNGINAFLFCFTCFYDLGWGI
jgi:hypothetical protein